MLPATLGWDWWLNECVAVLISSVCHSGTDNLFRCALRQWDMGVVKPGGTVTSRRHLLVIRVGELSLAYQALLVQRMSEPCGRSQHTQLIFHWHLIRQKESGKQCALLHPERVPSCGSPWIDISVCVQTNQSGKVSLKRCFSLWTEPVKLFPLCFQFDIYHFIFWKFRHYLITPTPMERGLKSTKDFWSFSRNFDFLFGMKMRRQWLRFYFWVNILLNSQVNKHMLNYSLNTKTSHKICDMT